MNINHIFLAFTAVVGTACGALLIAKPELRDAAFMPYLWVLLAMAVFELGMYARFGGAFINVYVRLLGFLLAVVLMVVIPALSGSPGRLF